MKRLYLFGAGGHGRELAWLAEDVTDGDVDLVFLVDESRYLGAALNGIPIKLIQEEKFQPDSEFLVAIGDPTLRRKAASMFPDSLRAATLVHPSVLRSSRTHVADGVVLCAGTILTDNVSIGQHTHVNVACTISHDVVLGKFVTLSPGVHIAGNVNVEDEVFIGIGATIISGSLGRPLIIGKGSVVAAGACVIQSVEPGTMVAGVPAVRKK